MPAGPSHYAALLNRLRDRARYYGDCEHHVGLPKNVPEYLAAARIGARGGPPIVFLDNVHLASDLLREVLALHAYHDVWLVVSSRLSADGMKLPKALAAQLSAAEVNLGATYRQRGYSLLHWQMHLRGLSEAQRVAVKGSVRWSDFYSDLLVLRLMLEQYDWTRCFLPAWAQHRVLREILEQLVETHPGIDELLYIVAELGRHGLATDLRAVARMLVVDPSRVRDDARAAEEGGILSVDARSGTCRYWHESLARLYWETFALNRTTWARKARGLGAEVRP